MDVNWMKLTHNRVLQWAVVSMIMNVVSEALMVATMRGTVFRVIPQCISERDRCFGGTYCLHLQGQRVSQA
jgi:hypothetical protein